MIKFVFRLNLKRVNGNKQNGKAVNKVEKRVQMQKRRYKWT